MRCEEGSKRLCNVSLPSSAGLSFLSIHNCLYIQDSFPVSAEVAFPVTTPAAMFRLMRRCCPEGPMSLYTSFALYAGRSPIQKGLFHFLAVSPYSPASPSLDMESLGLKPLLPLPWGPRAGEGWAAESPHPEGSAKAHPTHPAHKCRMRGKMPR